MSLQEELPEQEAYAALIEITDDAAVRDGLLALAKGEPGKWFWEGFPDGSAVGLLCLKPGELYSLNHITP